MAASSCSTSDASTRDKFLSLFPDGAEAASEAFDALMVAQAESPARPFEVTTIKGEKLCFFFEVGYGNEVASMLSSIVSRHKSCIFHKAVGMSLSPCDPGVATLVDTLPCTECLNRIPKLLRMWGKNGSVLFAGLERDDVPDPFKPLFDACTLRKAQVMGIRVVEYGETVLYIPNFGVRDDGKKYYHFYAPTSDQSDEGIDAIYWARAAHKYFPLWDAFCKKHSAPGISASLEAVVHILNEDVPYGEKILGATKWGATCITDDYTRVSPMERSLRCMRAIAAAPALREVNPITDVWQPVCTFFHQLNSNLMEIVEVSGSRDQLAKWVASRFDPRVYMQTTAEPSEAQIHDTIRAMTENGGDPYTKVMKLSELPAYGGKLFVQDDDGSGLAALGAMVARATSSRSSGPPRGAAGFATRSREIGSIHGGMKYASHVQLFNGLESNDTVEVYVGQERDRDGIAYGACAAYTHHGGFSDFTKLPFWRSYPRAHPSSPHAGNLSKGWHRVSGILPVDDGAGPHQFIYIIPGAKLWDHNTNICHEEFIKTEFKRGFRKVFGRLKNMTKPRIPDGPLAVGFGICRATADGLTVTQTGMNNRDSALMVRINGEIHKMHRFSYPKDVFIPVETRDDGAVTASSTDVSVSLLS